MPLPFNQPAEEEDDPTFDEVSSMADRLGLEGQQRANYIDDHMVGLGYEPVQSRSSYMRKQTEQGPPEDTASSRWGIGRNRQQQQGGAPPRTSGNPRNPRDDGDGF